MPLTKRTFLASAAASIVPGLAHAAQGAIALPGDISRADPTTITAVATRQPRVALTFDDGPHPRETPRLLDMLAARGIRATFYLIGDRVQRYPRLTARIAAEGHEIGNHSWSHPFLDRMSDAQVLSQIDRTTLAIFEATTRAPVTFRPPYGAFTARQRRMLHDQRGLPSVLWSVDPRDWTRPGPAAVARRILGATRPGSIVLSHDIHRDTVTAMPQVLDGLKARGFQMETLSGLIGWPDWSTRRFVRRS